MLNAPLMLTVFLAFAQMTPVPAPHYQDWQQQEVTIPFVVLTMLPHGTFTVTASLSKTQVPTADLPALTHTVLQHELGTTSELYADSTPGMYSLLALNATRSKAVLLTRTAGASVTVQATVITLSTPRFTLPGRFTRQADPSGFWTGTVVAPALLPQGPACPEFRLTAQGIEITGPAQPLQPVRTLRVDSLRCTDLEVTYQPKGVYGVYKPVTVRAKSWQDAWNLVEKTQSGMIQLEYAIHLSVNNGTATIKSTSGLKPSKDALVAVQRNGQPLLPLLYNREVTPQPIVAGMNRFFQRGGILAGPYPLIEIDTRNNTVSLYPKVDWPNR